MIEHLQTELDRQKRLLQRIESMAGIGHWRVNIDEKSVYWSEEIYKIHGVDPAEGDIGLEQAVQFFHPDDREEVQKKVENGIEKQKEFTFRARLVRSDGIVRHVESYGEPNIIDGKIESLFGIFRDITDQTEKQQELIDTHNFLKLIIENIPDPIFMKDSKSRILMGNAAFLNLYPSYMRDDIIGKTTVEDYDPEQAAAFLEEDKKAIKKGYTEIYETLDFPDGIRRTLFTKKVGVTRANGEKNLLGIARDVSDIQKIQDELERSNKDLQDFAFTVSHDLKAPLRHISMSASFIEDALKNKLDENEQEFFKIMLEGAEKAQFMIDNLLEYSRIGRADIELKKIDLNKLVNNVLSTLTFELDEIGAEISLKDLPTINGNEGLLIQLFQNMIQNALKYREKNKAPKIKIYHEKSGNFDNIHIEDNGIGIEPEYADKIFLMFQRLHGEDTDYKGMGIGLAICQKIIRAHKGYISLDKDYKKGAGFIVSFPLG